MLAVQVGRAVLPQNEMNWIRDELMLALCRDYMMLGGSDGRSMYTHPCKSYGNLSYPQNYLLRSRAFVVCML